MSVEYKKIKPKKLYEEVADHLKKMIEQGNLKPGEKLESVPKLADHFQVGRSVIREALSALRAMGLLEMKQGEGTYIKMYSADHIDLSSHPILMEKSDIVHLIEVRKVIESGAVVYAAKNRTDEDIKRLEAVVKEMRAALDEENGEEKSDTAFHIALIEATHNPMFISLMKQISGTMKIRMKEIRDIWLFRGGITKEDLYRDHVRILKAIIDRDEQRAQKLMWNHLTIVEENLSAYYQENNL
ncbi:MAG: FadR/GntR family transcriptional regulator [Bacillus sp. (in: firmicutes)]